MRLALATLLAVGALAGAASAQASVGSMAPEIEARDWYNAPPAKSLAELRGKVILLVLWAPW